MAFATETHSVGSNLAQRIATFARDLRAFNAQYRVYRQTVRELSQLSNRELDDLGLNRSTINAVAYEAAYGR